MRLPRMSPEVRDFLDSAGVRYRTHSHAPLVSFEEGQGGSPVRLERYGERAGVLYAGQAFAIVALRGADRADYKKIADALDIRRADLRAADPAVVAAKLGMQLGGIVPLPIRGALVLIDQAVAGLGTIFCGSGRNDVTLEISARLGADRLRVSGPREGCLRRIPSSVPGQTDPGQA